jgi:opacity protein-like surface antigen
MKKLTIILSLLLVVPLAYAQDYENDEIQSIFTRKKSNGGYGAFSLGYSQIDGRDALIAGARGAFIFDHMLAIGLGGYGFVNNLDYHSYYHHETNTYDFTTTGGYGGILIEPIVAGKQPVHVSFPILLGIGGVALVDENSWDWNWDWDNNNDYYEYDNDVFFVAEPGIELEFNMARFFRLSASASYRFTSKLELYDPNTPDFRADPDLLEGFNFGMTFKFGKF